MSDRARADANGFPYVGYFSPEEGYGFAWSGRGTDPVEVTHGGVGEPVVARFTVPGGALRASWTADKLLAFFRLECERWIRDVREDAADEVYPSDLGAC